MIEKTWKTLEFEKVLSLFAKNAQSELGKNAFFNLKPEDSFLKTSVKLEYLKSTEYIYDNYGDINIGLVFDSEEEISRASKRGLLQISELYRILLLLESSARVLEYFKNFNDEEQKISDYFKVITLDGRLLKDLKHCLINDQELNPSATPELQHLNNQKVKKELEIENTVKKYLGDTKFNKKLQDNITTIRDGRTVFPVKREYKSTVRGIVHDTSSTGSTYFIEPEILVNLNNDLKNIENSIKEEEFKIIKDLSNKIGNISANLLSNLQSLKELDFYFTNIRYGKEHNYSIPIINNSLKLSDLFHPLIDEEKVVKTKVDVAENKKGLIITGPNTGGKTVILKSIGVSALLTKCGMMIPCSEESQIPYFDEIYTDIGDEQSIEQNLSTFSSHMVNLVNIINSFDKSKKNLFLFDELGAGTDPVEGAALAISIIEHLISNNSFLAVTTHYPELKIYALNSKDVINGSMQFSLETLKPTYKLILGIPGKSNAFAISKKLGLLDSIINNAEKHLSESDIKIEDTINTINEKLSNINEKEELIKSLEEEIKNEKLKNQLKLEKEREKFEKQKEKIINDSLELYKQALKEYDEIIKSANIIKSNLPKEVARKIQNERENIRNNLENIERKRNNKKKISRKSEISREDLSIGAEVKLIPLNKIATVIELPDESGNLKVQVGIMKLNYNIKDIELTENTSHEEKTKYKNLKSKFVKSEIDLRGLDSTEFIDRLDKYIDDCIISGLNEVTILHGKGQGILRDEAHKFLKKHPYVEEFRLGKIGEGDTGVTVVKLKNKK